MVISENKKTMMLVLIAFIFSFAIRLIWVEQFSDVEHVKFNDEFMITTNDGYYFAEGARDILAGVHQESDLSPVDSTFSKLTALLAISTPFSFESIIFYMPALFASLIVIPIILIARELNHLEAGFIAALVGSIAWSYYNRTMVGYYDTDMLNIVLPTVLLWSLILSIRTNNENYYFIAALDSIVYRSWYSQSYSLEFAFISLLVLYAGYQFIKKKEFKNTLLLIVFMIIAMMNLESWLRLLMVIAIFITLKMNRPLIQKYLYYLLGVSFALFIFTGGLNPILAQIKGYVVRDVVSADDVGLGVHFFSVVQTVREAGQIPFEMFANRISGHIITFIAAVLGYIWFAIRYPILLLALPMVGLGFLAYGIPGLINGGGLRFTIYAVPIMALGLGYLIFKVSKMLSDQLIHKKVAFIAQYLFMALLTIAALYPNISHIIAYKVPTVFTKQEVQILDKLKSISNREDYVVAWWDYGYPIRYYSDVKTLIDGGKHSGGVNFPVSFVLTSQQEVAAKMARLDVEYTQKRFALVDKKEWLGSNIEQMTIDYGFKDTNKFLSFLYQEKLELPEKTRDVYIYLSNRMFDIFPAILNFSNIDLMNGEQKTKPFLFTSKNFKDLGNIVDLGRNVKILKDQGVIQIGNQQTKINNFIITQYDQKGVLQKQLQQGDPNAPVHVIYMKNYNQFVVVDTQLLNSVFIQLFVLENHNGEFFEPVILNPWTKVYKLKI